MHKTMLYSSVRLEIWAALFERLVESDIRLELKSVDELQIN